MSNYPDLVHHYTEEGSESSRVEDANAPPEREKINGLKTIKTEEREDLEKFVSPLIGKFP